MSSATVTSKGQITLPKAVRDRLQLESGDRIEFVESAEGFLVVPSKRDIRELKGILPKPKKPVSVDAMNRSIAKMGQ